MLRFKNDILPLAAPSPLGIQASIYRKKGSLQLPEQGLANVPSAPPLRTNIINLASFVFKRSVDILADPAQDKLSILININREVAAGLMTHPLSTIPDSGLS